MNTPLPRMTADQFIAWAMERPDSKRLELFRGEVVETPREPVSHARVKMRALRALADAVESGGLPCEAFLGGVAVEVSDDTVYAPDAVMHCGPRLPDDAVKIVYPLIVVEVMSPATRERDAGEKLGGYLRMPSIRHCLLLDVENRTLIHHARSESGEVTTRVTGEGAVRLDPPGIALDVAGLFPGAVGEPALEEATPRS